jgi:plastocyanin
MCIVGKLCAKGSDCVTGVCTGGTCQTASCNDNVKNGTETDVDCGDTCGPCDLGKKCFLGTDCKSTICTSNVCAQLNGCDPTTATDLTAMSAVSIDFGGTFGLAYSPKCIKVSAGTKVTFNGSFSTHPLKAGVVQSGAEVPDAAGTTPLPTATTGLNTGTTATFTMSSAGSFGYYCIPHGTFGMNGAIFVQ